ncbi:hypothetical protein BDW72DRAFT_74559 [Aspergillus terricola var. indicus]
MSGNFTFPTETENRFIVADLVNVTWDVVAPVISLYENCGTNGRMIQEQIMNNYSFVWTATRKGYVESGCNFMLQPFTADREPYGNNITSILFGVSKRYTSDPPPVSYNFINNTTTSTTASFTSLATVGTSETTQPTTPTSTSGDSHGLSSTSKLGIGLGVPLSVLLLAVAIGAFIIYRRRTCQKDTQDNTATNQPSDGLAPLPVFIYKDPYNTRLSQTETIATSSQLSSNNQIPERTERPLSELMSAERAELG